MELKMEATSRRIIFKKTSSKTVFCHGVSAVQCSRNLWRLGSVVSIHVSSTSGNIFSPSGKVPKSHPSIPSSQLRWGNQGRLRLSHGSCGLWKQHYWKAMHISCCPLIHSWKVITNPHLPIWGSPDQGRGRNEPHGPETWHRCSCEARPGGLEIKLGFEWSSWRPVNRPWRTSGSKLTCHVTSAGQIVWGFPALEELEKISKPISNPSEIQQAGTTCGCRMQCYSWPVCIDLGDDVPCKFNFWRLHSTKSAQTSANFWTEVRQNQVVQSWIRANLLFVSSCCMLLQSPSVTRFLEGSHHLSEWWCWHRQDGGRCFRKSGEARHHHSGWGWKVLVCYWGIFQEEVDPAP